jgi:uncharacterized protein
LKVVAQALSRDVHQVMTDTSRAFDSGRAQEFRRMLPVALALCALGAIALRLADTQPSASGLEASVMLLTIFVAALVAAIAGFAFSALAAGVLAYICRDPAEMVRMLLVCSIAVQLYCSFMLLGKVTWRDVAPYLVGGLATAPLGILILKHVSSAQYAFALGLLLLAYAIYALTNPLHLNVRQRPALDFCVGALGGITGGLAAFPGAFPVIWCSARGLPKEQQRAIVQPYILVMQIATLAWLQYAYEERVDALLELWTLLPVALLGAYLGFSIFGRLSTAQFKTVVLALLGISGVLLIARAF